MSNCLKCLWRLRQCINLPGFILEGTTKSRAPSGGIWSTRSFVFPRIVVCSDRFCFPWLRARRSNASLTGLRRISRYRYFIRRSSPPSELSSIVKGGVFCCIQNENESTRISTFTSRHFKILVVFVPSRHHWFAEHILSQLPGSFSHTGEASVSIETNWVDPIPVAIDGKVDPAQIAWTLDPAVRTNRFSSGVSRVNSTYRYELQHGNINFKGRR